jgi:hypothetical protein
MKSRSTEITAGYVLLGLGLLFIILPSTLAISMFVTGAQIPEFIPSSTSEQNGTTIALTTFSNACLVLFLLAIPVWAGSIVTSRGVAMVKGVKLKLMAKSLKEATGVAERIDAGET